MTLWQLWKMQMELWLMVGLPLSVIGGIVYAIWLRRRSRNISTTEFRSRLKKLPK